MPKREPTALACPLCLGLDDPESMLEVAIERTNPPDAVIVALCRRCAFAVAKSVASSDQPEILERVRETGDAIARLINADATPGADNASKKQDRG